MQLNPITVEREIEPEVVEENHVAEVPNQVAVTPVQGSTITEAIESVVKAAAEEVSNESAGPITGSSDGEEVIKPPVENNEGPKLPDNLPAELHGVVAKLKEACLIFSLKFLIFLIFNIFGTHRGAKYYGLSVIITDNP